LLLLVATRLDRLPRTVLSRCQRLRVPTPTRALAPEWLAALDAQADSPALLELTGGAPLAAAELAARGVAELAGEMRQTLELAPGATPDPLELAARWYRDRPADRLAWLEAWAARCIRELAGASDVVDDTGRARLPKTGMAMNISTAFNLLDRIRAARAALETSLNTQLLFEDLLVGLAEARAGATADRRET